MKINTNHVQEQLDQIAESIDYANTDDLEEAIIALDLTLKRIKNLSKSVERYKFKALRKLELESA